MIGSFIPAVLAGATPGLTLFDIGLVAIVAVVLIATCRE